MATKSRISRRREAARQEGQTEYLAKRQELVRLAATTFREKGYQSTTLNDIAQLANLDRATVYYYVGSKQELLQESVEGILDANLDEVELLLQDREQRPRQKIKRLIELVLTSYEDNYPYAYVYIQQDMHKVAAEDSTWARDMAKKTRRFEQAVLELLTQAAGSGDFRTDVNPELASKALFGMLNWTHRWHSPRSKLKAADIAAVFDTLFCDGMRPRK